MISSGGRGSGENFRERIGLEELEGSKEKGEEGTEVEPETKKTRKKSLSVLEPFFS